MRHAHAVAMYWVIGVAWAIAFATVLGYAVARARERRLPQTRPLPDAVQPLPSPEDAEQRAARSWDAYVEARRNYLRHEEDRD